MKSDVSNAESQFAVLCSQLNSFGIQVITQYENIIAQLQTENKRLIDKYEPKKKEDTKTVGKKTEKNQGEKK